MLGVVQLLRITPLCRVLFFFSSRRRHTRLQGDWSSDVCSSDLRATVAIGLLQATSLPFIVTATQIGTTLGKISPVTGAALVCAGLLSVLIFPVTALGLLRGTPPPAGDAGAPAAIVPGGTR